MPTFVPHKNVCVVAPGVVKGRRRATPKVKFAPKAKFAPLVLSSDSHSKNLWSIYETAIRKVLIKMLGINASGWCTHLTPCGGLWSLVVRECRREWQ